MSEPIVFTREGTLEDFEQAKTLAVGFAASLPKGAKPDVILAATSLFVNSVFTKSVKPQYRVAVFDNFAAHIRKQLAENP